MVLPLPKGSISGLSLLAGFPQWPCQMIHCRKSWIAPNFFYEHLIWYGIYHRWYTSSQAGLWEKCFHRHSELLITRNGCIVVVSNRFSGPCAQEPSALHAPYSRMQYARTQYPRMQESADLRIHGFGYPRWREGVLEPIPGRYRGRL